MESINHTTNMNRPVSIENLGYFNFVYRIIFARIDSYGDIQGGGDQMTTFERRLACEWLVGEDR